MMKELETLEESEPELKDRLLQLIEDGDATVILSAEYTESLHELIKTEFISIENERLQLTEKGQQAKLLGVKKFLEQNAPMTEKIEVPDLKQVKAFKEISNRSFLTILFFFFICFVTLLTMMI